MGGICCGRSISPSRGAGRGIRWKFRYFPLTCAPSPVKDAFLSAGRAEADWSWFVTMAQSVLGSGEELVIAALLDQQGLCHSALPLIKRGDCLRAATSCYTTEFSPPFQDEKSAFLLGKGMARKCRELRLDALPDGLPSVAAFLAGLRSAGFAIGTYRHFANWHEEISDFSEYWKERSTRLKSLVQRKGKRLESAKRLAFERVDLRTDLDRGIALYEAIYAKSWKEPEAHERFMATLMRNLGAAGLAQLGVARIDGSPAAAQVWLVRPPRATIFKLAHDPAFDQHSPGSLLTHWMIRQIREIDGVCEFDFGRGNDDYKKLWLKNCRFRYGAVAVDPRSLQGAWRYMTEVVPTRLGQSGPRGKNKAAVEVSVPGRRAMFRAGRKHDAVSGYSFLSAGGARLCRVCRVSGGPWLAYAHSLVFHRRPAGHRHLGTELCPGYPRYRACRGFGHHG